MPLPFKIPNVPTLFMDGNWYLCDVIAVPWFYRRPARLPKVEPEEPKDRECYKDPLFL